jgi:AraC family transcriptional regulator, regulatory protein of adaptative response / methylated-DNA-[protein]-cysteine methyltransferase
MTRSQQQTLQLAAVTREDPRWQQVLARDRAADGQFYYSVKTTGVYCRPSCAARTARPENVTFHATTVAAEQAGFRACKRCKPDQPSSAIDHSARVTAACRLIEQSEQIPKLEGLAAKVGLSAFHFQRVFKAATGLTPRQYAVAHRSERVRTTLQNSQTVTDAIYDAGFGSNSRFYESANQVLGMTPTHFRNGGSDREIHFAVGQCSLGAVLVASSPVGVCAILLGDDPDLLVRDLQDRFPKANLIGGDSAFESLVAQVVGMIEAPGQTFNLPLDVRGTAFQQRVWQALRTIPAGETASYAQVAARIGAPTSMRAVAQACGANALAVAIPCHRVVRSDGSLSGYRWGVDRKRTLLAREASA